MSLDNFIPTIWSARLLQALRATLVFAQPNIINRDYQGEITAAGDTVKINTVGDVTIGDYTKSSMGDPEELDDETRTLKITEAKYFNFQVDDIDKAQQTPKIMGQAMQNAAYGLARSADSFVSSHYVDAGIALGSDASPWEIIKPSEAYEMLVDLSVALDENNVPIEGRFVVVPPWYEGLMLKDDRFVKGGTLNSENRLLNGQIGAGAGFNILKSNTVPSIGESEGVVANTKVIAGHNIAWSYAEQINQTEAYRPHNRFSDALKGLHTYGAKVVRPESLAVLSVKRPVR
ncbi:P22 phage major capsid protein family protein [Shouchella clausii]|uniref:P22 phage major capsid protein family protein n=1 Tax=Shouchella clausii TaxID=79880 RepID=UPI000BA5E4E9|nr:P22 phage major capsid protein family protein [Shouchella clausii]PAE96769.1 P22 coat protein - protein 5 domain protein [Shouchella clausii]